MFGHNSGTSQSEFDPRSRPLEVKRSKSIVFANNSEIVLELPGVVTKIKM